MLRVTESHDDLTIFRVVSGNFDEYKFVDKTIWRDKFDKKLNSTNFRSEKYDPTKYSNIILTILPNCTFRQICKVSNLNSSKSLEIF